MVYKGERDLDRETDRLTILLKSRVKYQHLNLVMT